MWTGDNLDIRHGMNSESVDLIYLDPPFNSNSNYAAHRLGSGRCGVQGRLDAEHVAEAWHGEVADREPTIYAAGLGHGKGMSPTRIIMAA